MPLKESPSKSKTKTKTKTKPAATSGSGSGTTKIDKISSPPPEEPLTSSAEKAEQEQTQVEQLKKPVKKRPLHPIETLLGEALVNAAGETISPKRFFVEDGVIGLYFAAHWCPPCKMLSADLMLLYEEVRKAEHKFEMIYVSSDVKEESFKEYLSKMPWWAVPYEDEERRENLAVNYNVSGIPLFLLLGAKTLEVITRHGRLFVMVDPRGDKFPWKDLPLPSASKPDSIPGIDKQPVAVTAEDKVETPDADRDSQSKSEEGTNSKAIEDGAPAHENGAHQDSTLKDGAPEEITPEEGTTSTRPSAPNRPTTSQEGQSQDST